MSTRAAPAPTITAPATTHPCLLQHVIRGLSPRGAALASAGTNVPELFPSLIPMAFSHPDLGTFLRTGSSQGKDPDARRGRETRNERTVQAVGASVLIASLERRKPRQVRHSLRFHCVTWGEYFSLPQICHL